jgi:hypothetical protein
MFAEPVINTQIIEVPALTNNTGMTIEYTVNPNDNFDMFRFTLEEFPDLNPW